MLWFEHCFHLSFCILPDERRRFGARNIVLLNENARMQNIYRPTLTTVVFSKEQKGTNLYNYTFYIML